MTAPSRRGRSQTHIPIVRLSEGDPEVPCRGGTHKNLLSTLRTPKTAAMPAEMDDLAPGQGGQYATTDATGVDTVTMTYNPDTDGDPDPGEIIWTWVPYEEADGRGKDRPVLVVARELAGTVLGVQLSSQDHSADNEWVSVGVGGWDDERRPSWVDTSRVLRIHEQGMRRESAALALDRFDAVAATLVERYNWTIDS